MIKNLFKNLIYRTSLDFVHPVGEIFISSDADFNPNTKWGGTWQLLQDNFLVGAGNTYTLGATGGEATHTLTLEEAPAHQHNTNIYANSSGSTPGGYVAYDQSVSGATYTTNTLGGGQPHNNLPPYTAVNMWLRTA